MLPCQFHHRRKGERGKGRKSEIIIDHPLTTSPFIGSGKTSITRNEQAKLFTILFISYFKLPLPPSSFIALAASHR
jgi:hypothetical protein